MHTVVHGWTTFHEELPLMAGSGVNSAALLTRSLLLAGAVLFLILISETTSEKTTSTTSNTSHSAGVCKSVDIRNSLKSLESLKGCRVVEGFVQIIFLDNLNETEVETFPELREITDFLLFYRVSGLKTLAKLFPNLSVIRGQQTFYNYALVLFEMPSLQEIGLISLTDIMSGSVRIDKNPQLCYLNTINWDLITHRKGDNLIRNMKPESECPVCTSAEDNAEKTELFCWNKDKMQKICPSNCTACNSKNKCCNQNCLGGCEDEDINKCYVCKNITIDTGDGDILCTKTCPSEQLEYLGRRCIYKDECLKTKRPIDVLGENYKLNEYPYKVFNKKCTMYCPPPDYMDNDEKRICELCNGRCKKVCPGANIDSVQTVEEMRGCTHINGSLEIQIRGVNIVSKLEENLGLIEEIDGYLKIVRSFPLITLHFLKSLRIIRGKNLESDKYSFVVLDNKNLQELWDNENRTLEIKRGRLFFHVNPKLCLYKIKQLQKMANLDDFTEYEVATNSNGDKIACNVETMVVSVEADSQSANFTWPQFEGADYRKLLGYVLYYIEAPYKNITLYDGRDACGEDGWKLVDVPNNITDTQIIFQLQALKPYKQYAYYVKTYTLDSEANSAQSKIQYFRTLPDEPSDVDDISIESNSSDSLFIKWQPPKQPNGIISHYVVTGYLNIVSSEANISCQEIIKHLDNAKKPDTSANKNQKDNCTCISIITKPIDLDYMSDLLHIVNSIEFENEIQNAVYQKNPVKNSTNTKKSKREITSTNDNDTDANNITKYKEDDRNLTEANSEIWLKFEFPIYDKTELFINNLKHFSTYSISIQACRIREEVNDYKPLCSKPYFAKEVPRTHKKEGADDILYLEYVNKTSEDSVTVTWKEPVDPNGAVIDYRIEYKRLSVENVNPLVSCISRETFLNSSMLYTLKNLNWGNYSLRVMATTLAGSGNYSNDIFFYIEEITSSSSHVVIIAVVVFLLILGLFGSIYVYKRKREKATNSMKLISKVNPDYDVYVPDEWEVPRKKIELLRELGQGSFGMVYEGIAKDIKGNNEIRCAVKTVNEHATNRERIEFLNEAAVMKAFDTQHVVRLLGVVSQGQPTLVIMELMANGDLKSFLRSHRPDAEIYDPNNIRHPPTLKMILQMAIEIADGMAYLAAKKFVHRDLAARNCMVAEDLTVKIGDFGMTRDIYETDYYRKGTKGLLPVRWMAPESLKDGVFTSSSDIWSYGVVLWEMATLASQPYQGLSNDQVLRYVIDGGIMEMPENCPDKLYKLMRHCWRHKPTDRPTFLDLCAFLYDDANLTFQQVSFYNSPAGIEARNNQNNESTPNNDVTTPLQTGHDLGENFSLSSDHEESDLDMDMDMDARIDFPSFPMLSNGYVTSGNTNGTTN